VEWGHMPYTEDQYGSGAQGATLYRIGYLTEIRPGFDPELERRYVLREGSEAGRALGVYGGRRMVRLGLTWLQGELADYFQGFALGGYNFYGEAKLKRGAGQEVYLAWTGLKLDALTVRCSVGAPLLWEAELVGKDVEVRTSTTNQYGAQPGEAWQWHQAHLEISTDGSQWDPIPDVTDWEVRVEQRLKPNYSFNSSGERSLQSLEEMEEACDARFTMYLPGEEYLGYLLDQETLHLKLVLPNNQYLQLCEGKLSTYDPVLRPEDLVACRVEFMGRYQAHGFG